MRCIATINHPLPTILSLPRPLLHPHKHTAASSGSGGVTEEEDVPTYLAIRGFKLVKRCAGRSLTFDKPGHYVVDEEEASD